MHIYFSDKHKILATGLRIGAMRFNGTLTGQNKALWRSVTSYSNILREKLRLDEINKQEVIAQTRLGYKRCGKDPNRYRPSADSLLRRIVKGNGLYQVNNVVDVLNFISLRSGFSIGGYNLDAIQGKIVIDIGQPNDHYIGIGKGELNIEGLPVLRDQSGTFGNPTSDSVRTMIKEGTNSFLFCFFDFGKNEKLNNALHECKELLVEFADGRDFEIDIIAHS